MSLQRSQSYPRPSLIYSSLPSRFRPTFGSRSTRSNAWLKRLLWTGAILLSGAPEALRAASLLLAASVGQQSLPVSITVTLSASGVATAPQALTQGIAGVDFSVANGGTCAANASYVSGQQCTVNVVFAPKYPGLRVGAVV